MFLHMPGILLNNWCHISALFQAFDTEEQLKDCLEKWVVWLLDPWYPVEFFSGHQLSLPVFSYS